MESRCGFFFRSDNILKYLGGNYKCKMNMLVHVVNSNIWTVFNSPVLLCLKLHYNCIKGVFKCRKNIDNYN